MSIDHGPLCLSAAVVGTFIGTKLARRLSRKQGQLPMGFAVRIFMVAAYRLWQSGSAILA